MPSTTAHQSKFVWYELMTRDTSSAAAFYQSVIGWDAKPAGPAHGDYMIFSADSWGIGGMMGLTDEACVAGARPGWVGYIWVEDVDAYAAKVKAAGGAVHRDPADIPGIGRFAMVADPHGAVFMLFKNIDGPEQTPVTAGTVGHLGWHELHAGDGVCAFAFYSGLFGWAKSDATVMGPLEVYQLFANGGEVVGGRMTRVPKIP